ncbi:LPD29 domain-containing protein [Paenibacillus provencensis]|uniref:LPD29 domain-containing protein n=1 Tax=Paenibacillus provencensis TaxID=441151 RepID=A0ABW3Q0T0_9BACL
MSTVQEMFNISGKDAKKHVSEALKIVFPGIKFKFSTSYDSIHVAWTDGPLVQDVERVLNRFQSYTYVYSKTDFYRPTGYEWKGAMYLGPEYLTTSRTLSDGRRDVLYTAAEAQGMIWVDMIIPERRELEEELIRKGNLEGKYPRTCPDLLRDSRPSVDERKKKETVKPKAEVIELFPAQTAKDVLLKYSTPEDRFKFSALANYLGENVALDLIQGSDLSIDDLFILVANEHFS